MKKSIILSIFFALLLPLATAFANSSSISTKPLVPSLDAYNYPRYPIEAVEFNLSGEVTLQVTVNPEGQTIQSKVLQSSGYDSFDRAALNAAPNLQFENPDKLTHVFPIKIRYLSDYPSKTK